MTKLPEKLTLEEREFYDKVNGELALSVAKILDKIQKRQSDPNRSMQTFYYNNQLFDIIEDFWEKMSAFSKSLDIE